MGGEQPLAAPLSPIISAIALLAALHPTMTSTACCTSGGAVPFLCEMGEAVLC